MQKKKIILIGTIVIIIAIILFSINKKPQEKEITQIKEVKEEIIDWNKYNYDYIEEDVKKNLNSMIDPNSKTAFYLPPTGYINVSKGQKFGVAYALNNPNPSGENYFEFNWSADENTAKNCGITATEAKTWIERGWTSFGKIPKGWIDHMTVYFSFPEDAPSCNIKYNFIITKDKTFYDSKTLEFNIN